MSLPSACLDILIWGQAVSAWYAIFYVKNVSDAQRILSSFASRSGIVVFCVRGAYHVASKELILYLETEISTQNDIERCFTTMGVKSIMVYALKEDFVNVHLRAATERSDGIVSIALGGEPRRAVDRSVSPDEEVGFFYELALPGRC